MIAIRSLSEAVDALEPLDVVYYKLSAERPDAGRAEDEESGEANVEVWTARRIGQRGVDYRCHLRLSFPNGQVVSVDSAVLFQAPEDVEIEPNVANEFGNEVAIMALFPYLRQTVWDLAGRLGVTATLPLMHRGQITFTDPEPGEDGKV